MRLAEKPKKLALRAILFALPSIIRQAAKKHKAVRDKLHSGNCIAQLRLRDRSIARYYVFRNGKITASWGVHPSPDTAMVFATADTALAMMRTESGLRGSHRCHQELQGDGR